MLEIVKNIKFACMDNLHMTFPNEIFDLISARHTIINAKQIYDCLVPGGTIVIRGVDKKDCWEIKELFEIITSANCISKSKQLKQHFFLAHHNRYNQIELMLIPLDLVFG